MAVIRTISIAPGANTGWHYHPALVQAVLLSGELTRVLEDGTVDRHLRRAGRIYSQRYQIVRAALAGPLSPWLTALPAQAGAFRAAVQHDAGRSRDRGGRGDGDRPYVGRRVVHDILHQ